MQELWLQLSILIETNVIKYYNCLLLSCKIDEVSDLDTGNFLFFHD